MTQDKVFAEFPVISYVKSLLARVCPARLLLLSASLVLGLNYPGDALATCARVLSSTGSFTGKCVHPENPSVSCLCSTATTSIKLGATHSGVEIACGDPSQQIVLGQENLHEYFLGVSEPHDTTTPRKITVDIDVGTTKCKGTDLNTKQSVGEGNFKYRVRYEIDIATNADLKKKTADNDCVNFNPDAPPTKGKTSCRVNQTCTNVSDSEAQVNVDAYCQAGVEVFGELTWLDPHPTTLGDQPPQFTGCEADATDCTLRLGGLPRDDQNKVLPDVCDLIFTATTNLAQKQMLSVRQDFAGQCTSPTSVSYDNPVGVGRAVSRECHSDEFDNVEHGCPVLTDGKKVFVHTASAVENAKVAPVTIEVTPESLSLGCLESGKDSGVIKATICGAADFDVSTVALFSNNKFDPNVAPVLQTVKPTAFTIGQTIGGACGSDLFPDLTLTYPTCRKPQPGVAQVVFTQNQNLQNQDTVTLELQGQLNTQTGDLLPKIIGGTDTVKVTNVPTP
jgi:hypothetical protein